MVGLIRPAALLLSAGLALTFVASATASAQTRSVKIHTYDLDLATKTGQAELQRRIDRAVGQVCGSGAGARMDDIMSYASCSKAAQANAMSRYDEVVRAAHDPKLAGNQNRDLVVR